ncbi:MAG: IS256 family transposase, partial [Myxococcales bacterium]|nr:IS256 family transposase [Myxococcales bacterium]
ASTRTEATEQLQQFITRHEKTAPALAQWAETALPEGFAVFQLPVVHQKKMRTSNLLERLNKEIKLRTRVATMFPNEASCLRLISAILIEISEEWETGWRYLSAETEETG